MLSPEAIRLRKVGTGPLRFAAHGGNIVRDAWASACQAAAFLTSRYGQRVRMPGFFVLNKAHRYTLNYHGEHLPSADSCVTLSRDTDALGQPRLHVDLRFHEQDALSVVGTHELIDARLRGAGIGRLDYKTPPEERVAVVLSQASDGFHQIGTARMSASERDGIVDADAKVHGVSNLFLAGSAIFPSSGQANPTLTAIALAARLAAHLQGVHRALPEPALAS
jgi:choline dehydrogenase-like flavoprotein